MTHKLQRLNCFWLLSPAFVWNMALAPRLAQAGSATDAGVPQPVLAAEWALRIAVLAWSLFWLHRRSRSHVQH